MEAKKNEKLRLEKNSGLYFAMGLTLVLALAYLGLEWKSFDKKPKFTAQLEKPDFIPNDLTPVIKPPEPPKPKIAPPIIEIVPDTSDEPDTFIDMPEVDHTTEIPEPESIPDFEEPPIDDEIIFVNVEEKPIFPGCEDASDKYTCFQEMILKHVRNVFQYPDEAQEIGLQGRVNVMFTIQKDGSIGNVRMRGPHKILEDEAARIISKLPKMQPGKQRGTPVKVPFSIPITFRLQ